MASTTANFRNMSVKELKDICRSDPRKYYGFSKLKKSDLIDFMYRRNSSSVSVARYQVPIQRSPPRPSYNLSDVSHIFETPDEREERIQSYYEPKPEDSIIEDLMSILSRRYRNSSITFDKHEDANNDIIYKGNKGKYITQHGSLGEHGEGILYHGTDEKNLISILNDDFRLTTNPVHGHLYGKGIYFTNDIEKAIYYSERGKSTKYVIVAMVHIGDICLGNASMDVHPKMPNLDKAFDTSVDNVRKPRQFIKKKNGTYNILGIITIENYSEDRSSKFSGGFQIINYRDHPVTLYWIPPNTSYYPGSNLPKLTMCKRMSTIPATLSTTHPNFRPGTTKQLCQIGHEFVCVYHRGHSGYNDYLKIFTSTKKGEIITI